MGGTGLDADLGDPRQVAPHHSLPVLQLRHVGGHEGVQLLHGRVALTDLADLAANGDGDPGRFPLPDELGEHGGQVRVELLLLGQRRQGDIDDGRGIDVDIEVAGRDRLAGQLAQGIQLALRVAGPVLGTDLVVVALDEDWPLMPLLDRRRQRVASVFTRSLLGVGHLGAGQLEEHDLAVVGARGAVDGAHGVVGESAHIDGRSGAVGIFATAGGHVEGMDRRGPGAERGCGHADDPAGGVPLRSLRKDGGGDQTIDQPVSQSGGIEDLDSCLSRTAARVDADDAVQGLEQIGERREGEHGISRGHGVPPNQRVADGDHSAKWRRAAADGPREPCHGAFRLLAVGY